MHFNSLGGRKKHPENSQYGFPLSFERQRNKLHNGSQRIRGFSGLHITHAASLMLHSCPVVLPNRNNRKLVHFNFSIIHVALLIDYAFQSARGKKYRPLKIFRDEKTLSKI